MSVSVLYVPRSATERHGSKYLCNVIIYFSYPYPTKKGQYNKSFIHTYHSHFIPEGSRGNSDIPPRHPRFTKIS
jgi:hypothetical protein